MTGGLPYPLKPSKRTGAVALLVTLAFLASGLALPAHAQDEPAQDDGVLRVDRLVEAEWYQAADALCDPDFDGEHTQVHSDPGSSGGAHVFLPHSGCGIDFGNVTFESDLALADFVVQVGGSNQTFAGVVRVLVDGEVHATGAYHAHPTDGFRPYPFDPQTAPIVAGTHHLRIEFDTTTGPFFGNLFIDVLRGDPTGGGGGGGGGPALPDLQVTFDHISADPWDPSNLRAVFRLDNTGGGFAHGFSIDVWYDGAYAGRIDHPFPFGPGFTTWNSLPWPFTTGAHTIDAVIDPDGLVEESDETNNEAHKDIPADTPDAYINLVWEPEPIDANGFSTARFSVFSVGTAPMPATTVEVRLGDTVRATADVPALGSGEATAMTVPFPAEPGDHILTLTVDPAHEIVELDERRNKWRMPVHLEPQAEPDLEVMITMPDLDGHQYGDVVAVEGFVSNSGDGQALPTRATWTIGGEERAMDIPALEPGTSHLVRTEIALTPGIQEILLRVEPAEGETDHERNQAAFQIDLGAPALQAVSIELDDAAPAEGVPVDVTARFAYNGTLGLPEARAALYDGDRLLATWDLHDLAPDSPHQIGFGWSPKEGEHTLRFVVEAIGTSEADLSDNGIERNVTVRSPTPATCRDAGMVTGHAGLRESCRRILLGEDDPLGPL